MRYPLFCAFKHKTGMILDTGRGDWLIRRSEIYLDNGYFRHGEESERHNAAAESS